MESFPPEQFTKHRRPHVRDTPRRPRWVPPPRAQRRAGTRMPNGQPHRRSSRRPRRTQAHLCVYAGSMAGRCVYAGRGAYTRVGAFTRVQVGAYTQRFSAGAHMHPGVYITRGSVRLRLVYASGGCVYTGGAAYTHPLAYTSRIHRFLQIQVRACTVTSPSPHRTSSCQHRLKRQTETRVFRFELQDYLFLNKINPLQGNAITIHSMSMTLGV